MPTVRNYFENPQVKSVIRKYTNFAFVDIDGVSGDDLGLSLADECPDTIDACDPELLIKLPARYAFFCRIRDLTGSELREAQRVRKNARAMYYHRAANPDVADANKPTGLTKLTEKAIDSWVETRKDVMLANEKYDRVESEYTMLCSACEAIRIYIDILRDFVRKSSFEEKYADTSPEYRQFSYPPSREKEVDSKSIIAKAKQDLKKLRKPKTEPKKRIQAMGDPDILE